MLLFAKLMFLMSTIVHIFYHGKTLKLQYTQQINYGSINKSGF